MYCTSCGKQIMDDALAELVSAARIGNQDAISDLYEKTYSKVYYIVKSIIKDEDAVFDIVQDTYIKAFSHLDSFQGDTRFLQWVSRCRSYPYPWTKIIKNFSKTCNHLAYLVVS